MRHRFIFIAALAALLPTAAVAQSADRWQITLDDDRILWDLRLLKLDGGTLDVRLSDSTVRVPLARVKELRLLQKSTVELTEGAAGGAMNALTGADDEIHDFTPLSPDERVEAVQKILRQHAAPAAP